MAKFSKERILVDAFLVIALFAFAIVGLLSYQKTQELIDSNKWVIHTYQVRETVTQSQLALKDLRINIRDYVITGDVKTLKNVLTLLNYVEQKIEIAKKLTADNISQQQRLNKLENLMKTKYLFLWKKNFTTINKEHLVHLVTDQKEQAQTLLISQLYNEVLKHEHNLLSVRNIRVDDEAQHTLWIVIFTIAVTEVLLVVCLILLNINLNKRDEIEKKLELSLENLKRSNTELEQFAYIASHDLQEPLRMVVSYTQLLERRYKDKLDADANEFINYAVDGAKRMQILLVNLLMYSRVTRQDNPFEQINFEKIYDDTMLNLEALIADKKAIIKHGKLPNVVGDKVQLTQLLQNLIANALKFMPENVIPKIKISATLDKNEWVFAVKDNGIGIEPDYFDKIFIIFKRLHTRTEYPGTGIGLALCKKIVEKHGGRIWLTSAVGKGTTFYFTLPKIKE